MHIFKAIPLRCPRRILLAFYPQPDPEARAVTKKMLAVCVSGDTPVDWDEIRRLACLPSFNVAKELDELRKEVARTWEEWQQSRATRRAVAERIGPAVIRRTASSSDVRLCDAFNGQRGPDFTRKRERVHSRG